MKKTKFEIFGEKANAKVISTDEAYAKSVVRETGLDFGINDLRLITKALKQSSLGAATTAEFIAKFTTLPEINDKMTTEQLVDGFTVAVQNVAALSTGGGNNQQHVDVPESIHKATVRNLILSGRTQDGANGVPSFLVPGYGEMVDLEMELGYDVSPAGKVRSSSEHAVNPARQVFANMKVAATPHAWITSIDTSESDMFISLTTPRRFSAMELVFSDSLSSPRVLELSGYETEGDFEMVFQELNNEPALPSQTTIVEKSFSRIYYFMDNAKHYSNYKLHIAKPHTVTARHTGHILSIRFFEAPIPGVHHFDTVLMASEDEPFKVAIAEGFAGDRIIKIEEPVVIAGQLLAEMSRNYIYLVPANKDSTVPDYVKDEKHVYIPKSNAYLVTSTKKILSAVSERQIVKQCLLNLQSTETSIVEYKNTVVTPAAGGMQHRVMASNVSTEPSEKPRGAKSSFAFITGDNWIYPGLDVKTAFRDATTYHYPSHDDWTVELDFKYGGPDYTANDDAMVLLEVAGNSTSGGFIVWYQHRRGQIVLVVNSNGDFYTPYAADDKWHTLSVSSTNKKIFVHVDGKCLSMFDTLRNSKAHYGFWMLGKRASSATMHWRGYLNNAKILLGQCLRQGEDYVVSTTYDTNPITEGTRWYDSSEGVVKTWNGTTHKWDNTPMICIGHVDTGYKEHLHSEQPRGISDAPYCLQAVQPGSWNASNQFDAGRYSIKSLFNFQNGGMYTYIVTNTTVLNDTDITLDFMTKKPVSFEEFRLITTHDAWSTTIPIFKFQQSKTPDVDGLVDTLDRSVFVRDGTVNAACRHHSPESHLIHGMKRFFITDTEEYILHRLLLLAKGGGATDIFFVNQRTSARLQLVLRDARPEVQSCTSYVIGDTYMYGPIMIVKGTTYSIPAPFGGLNYQPEGYVLETNDYEKKWRKLGQQIGHFNAGHFYGGEVVYINDNEVTVQTGNAWMSLCIDAGKHNTINASSAEATLYLVCKRLF